MLAMSQPQDQYEQWQQLLNKEKTQYAYEDQDWKDATISPAVTAPPPPPYASLPEPYMPVNRPKATGFSTLSTNAKIATLCFTCLLIAFVFLLFIVYGPSKGSITAHNASISMSAPSATQTTVSSIVPTTAPSSVPTVAPTQPATVPTNTTGVQQNQTSQTACQAVNNNPWCYNFSPGSLIYSPNAAFCNYFSCVSTFWVDTNGYVAECANGRFTHSDGVSGACSRDGGVLRTLYSHPASTPTPVPIQQPTPIPTQQPTPIPTPVPTQQPTPIPTPVPTPIPTPIPTPMPTPIPTTVPTPLPTPTSTQVSS